MYRALRGTPHSFVDDVFMGTALGFGLELAAWAAFSAADLRGALWCWPAFVVAAFLAVKPLRRHWRPAYDRAPSMAWCWSVAAILLLVLVSLATLYFAHYPPYPSSPNRVVPDLVYAQSLVGEAKHHFPPHTPQVAAEPLNYHWFMYAHQAAASLVTGLPVPVVFYRLALPVVLGVAVPLLAVVGWRVSGRPWVGVLACALTFAACELSVDANAGMADSTPYLLWASPSFTYALLAMFPLITLVADRIKPAAPGFGRGGWVLLALFALLAAGSKSTVLPLVAGGLFAVAAVSALRRRRFSRPLFATAAVVLAVQLLATVVLFRMQTYGLQPNPFGFFVGYVDAGRSGPWTQALLVALVVVAYAAYGLIRMAGIAALATRGRRFGQTERFLLGALASGWLASVVLLHPTGGQLFFVTMAVPFGAVLSAMGCAALVERHDIGARSLRVVVGWTAIAVLAAWVGLIRLRQDLPEARLPYVKYSLPIFLMAALVALGALAAWALPRVLRRGARARSIGSVVALAALVLAGWPSMLLPAVGSNRQTPEKGDDVNIVGPHELATAEFLRDHVPADQPVATNQHCVAVPGGCAHVSFWLTAYSERRLLVGSWSYVPRTVAEAGRTGSGLFLSPFWDPELLARNDAVFYQPTAAGVADLTARHGVHWLVVDRAQGAESPALRELARLRFERGPYAVYELA